MSTTLSTPSPIAIQPQDGANQRLLENVHPATWQNPQPSGRYNLVVIGGGTAGLVAAIGGALLGGKVALIERDLLGGDCLNWGCVPSKAIIRPAKLVAEIRRAGQMGVHVTGGPSVDFGQVMARMREIRAEISHDDSAQRVLREGVELFLGSGRFTGPETIEVVHGEEVRSLTFAKAVIATGSTAAVPDVPGLREAGFLTNHTLFQLTEQPRRLAVIGGGPIGAEMAQTFARFGTEVTLLEKGSHILSREDGDAAGIVQQAMLDDGVALLLKAGVKSVALRDGAKVVTYEQGGAQHELTVDEILVAAGRTPGVKGLNLEAAGVDYDERQGVRVDDTLRTTNPNIYASGDVAMAYKFTHMADATSRIVVQNALFPGPKKRASDLIVPWCTYTDPEIAHVGLYPRQAEERGIAIDTFSHPFAEVDRNRTDGHTEGFVKVHVKRGTDKILGATIVGANAGELINQVTLAMQTGAGLKRFSTLIYPYPTQSEVFKKVASAYSRTRLTPLVKRIFRAWLSWRR